MSNALRACNLRCVLFCQQSCYSSVFLYGYNRRRVCMSGITRMSRTIFIIILYFLITIIFSRFFFFFLFKCLKRDTQYNIRSTKNNLHNKVSFKLSIRFKHIFFLIIRSNELIINSLLVST